MSNTKQAGAIGPVKKCNPLTRHISSLRLVTVYFRKKEPDRVTYFVLGKDIKRVVADLVRRYRFEDVLRITSAKPGYTIGPAGAREVLFEDDAPNCVVWTPSDDEDDDFMDE